MTPTITRERLAYLKTEAGANCRGSDPVEWSLTVAEAHALIAMAERLLQVERFAPRCRQCGNTVEPERYVYATPVCFACLPPPKPLPTAATKEGDRR